MIVEVKKTSINIPITLIDISMYKFVIIFSLLFCAGIRDLRANIIRVGKGENIQSIQKAIEMAANGDTVIVGEGTYRQGNIIINKPLVLKGLNHPVLDGEKMHEVISVRAPYVTIDGFLIRGSGNSSMIDIAGIKIYNTHHVVVINNILEDNFFGIYSQQARS